MEYMNQETLAKLHQIQVEILDEIVRVCNENNIQYFLVGGTLLGAVRHKGFIPWDDDIDIGMTRKDFNNFVKIAQEKLNDNYLIEYKDYNKDYYLNFAKIMRVNTVFEEKEKSKYKGPKGIFVDVFPFENTNKLDSIFQCIQAKVSNGIRNVLYSRIGFKGNNKIKECLKKCFMIFSNYRLLKFQENVMTLNKNDDSKYITAFSGAYNYKKDTYLRSKIFPLKELVFEGKKYTVPGDYDYYLNKLYGNYMELPPKEKRTTHKPQKIEFYKEDVK